MAFTMLEFRKCQPEKPKKGRATRGKVRHYRTIKEGGERHFERGKLFASITVEGGKKERGPYPFVIKKFPNKRGALEELRKAIDLKEAGAPVPKTVRYAEEKDVHMLLYSDLTEGGEYEVWSINNPQTELFYLDLTAEDIRAVKKLLGKAAQKATSAGYRVHDDAYFLRRKHDGSVDVVIGDLGWGVCKIPRDEVDDETRTGGNMRRAAYFAKRVELYLENNHALSQAFVRHTKKRLLPLAEGIRMITEALEKGGHTRKEMAAVFEKCNIDEEAEDLLTHPLESDKGVLCLKHIENVNPTLAANIRSGDLSINDLERAATLYRYAKGTNERLRQRIKRAGLQIPR